jgi:hypothetical protein
MYFPDLGTITQIVSAPYVRAVGWLDASQSFPTGVSESRVVDRIRAFAAAWGSSVKALGWPIFMGMHTCNLCGVARASGNFGVPRGEVLFVCPEMIVHYVADHGYLPPGEFLDAIITVDTPGTDGYARSVAMFARLYDEWFRADMASRRNR